MHTDPTIIPPTVLVELPDQLVIGDVTIYGIFVGWESTAVGDSDRVHRFRQPGDPDRPERVIALRLDRWLRIPILRRWPS